MRWNWTLSRIQAQILAYPDAPVWVGQMYITSSGATEIHISLDNPDLLSPYLKIAVNGTVTVDWGDGTSTDTVTGTSDATSIFTPHTYATTGDYVISISVTNGKFVFHDQFILTHANEQSVQAYRYSSYIDAVYIGSGMTSIEESSFQGCYSLQSITIPSSVTIIRTYAFQNCQALQSITIPSGVTSIGTNAFQNCYALQSITIPSSVTTIGTNAFQNCYALQSITIPSGVTSIKPYAFSSCSAIYEYHLLPTTPPSLTNKNTFNGIASDCVIYVPSASLEAYQKAKNWSNYASKMVGE